MKAVILAGGYGTRLLDLGKKIPKGLIKVGKTTLVGRVIASLTETPLIDSIGIVSNDTFYSQYKNWLKKEGCKNIKLLSNGVTSIDKRLGALGDLLYALKILDWKKEEVIIFPSDTFYDFPLSELIAVYQKQQNFTTVVRQFTKKEEIANRLGCAVMKNNRIIEFIEKPADPPSLFGAVPIYIYPPKTIALLENYKNEGGNLDAPGSIIPYIIKNKQPVYAYITTKITIDVGTPPDVAQITKLAKF